MFFEYVKSLIIYCSITILFTHGKLVAQKTSLIDSFTPLIGRTWSGTGNWGDGTVFKQKVNFTQSLDGRIITVISEGFIDEERTKWGTRNHGIRAWDEECKCYRFWEFDVFGGLTTGKIELRKDTIFYHYNYNGTDISDCWIRINDFKYEFVVGAWNGDSWKQKYLSTVFIAQPKLIGDKNEINKIIDRGAAFSETYMEENHLKLATFYTGNGKIMPNGASIIRGTDAIAERWKLPEGTQIHSHKSYPEQIELIGDTAIDYGYYEGSSQNLGEEVSHWKGKYVIIWKKVNDEWLMDIDIWNRVN